MRGAQAVVASLLAAVLALAACHIEEPFVRDNHWDSGSNTTKQLTGTDSTFGLGDRIVLTLTGDPPLPPGPLQVEWVGVNDTAVRVLPSGYGEFAVTLAHAEYTLVRVGARFDASVVAKEVWVGQKVGSLQLFCGTAAAPVACAVSLAAPGALRDIGSRMLDRNGAALRRPAGAMARATWRSREPSILDASPILPNAFGNFQVRGVSPGSTWLVVTADGVTDSVQVTVVP